MSQWPEHEGTWDRVLPPYGLPTPVIPLRARSHGTGQMAL